MSDLHKDWATRFSLAPYTAACATLLDLLVIDRSFKRLQTTPTHHIFPVL
jgi:hypothetical protein